MKKWFLAQEEPPRHRVTTCQKCIRTPDIERVGITARHGTFFEMLGNFSFQDYFKEEVIPWAWEFLTSDEWMAIPKDRLHISVYEEDDEAYDIWTKKVGIAPDHMVRLGKEDNFWEHGSGPCGPCSEIYFDRGPEYGCGKPTCGVGCDCDRYMEIWNLVFSQFDADGKGHYERLARPNIDTGMGLERLACVMQGVGNLFEVDTVQSVLHHVEHIANKTYGEDDKTDISIRVITDHIRSCTFMVSDGILLPTRAVAMCCAACCAVLPAMAVCWASPARSWWSWWRLSSSPARAHTPSCASTMLISRRSSAPRRQTLPVPLMPA